MQGVVGPRHVAELPKADTVPQQVFQEVGVQQQQVRQGGRHGDCRRELPGLVALRQPVPSARTELREPVFPDQCGKVAFQQRVMKVEQPGMVFHLHSLPAVTVASVRLFLRPAPGPAHQLRGFPFLLFRKETEVDVPAFARQRMFIEGGHALAFQQYGMQAVTAHPLRQQAYHHVHPPVLPLDAVGLRHPAYHQGVAGQQRFRQVVQAAADNARHGLAHRHPVHVPPLRVRKREG